MSEETQNTEVKSESTENVEVVEMVNVKGYEIPKHIHQGIIDSVQKSINTRHKEQLASIIGEEDVNSKSYQQLIDGLNNKLTTMPEPAQPQANPENIKEILEMERQKIVAEFAQKEKERQDQWQKKMQVDSIRSHSIQMGLSPEFNDIFDTMVDKQFAIETVDGKTVFKDRKSDNIIFDESGEPAGAGKIAEVIKGRYPGVFAQVKQGLGSKSNGSVAKQDWSKMSVEELLSSR